MRQYDFTAQAPHGWDARLSRCGAIFGSTRWQEVLEAGFSVRTIYGWNGTVGAAITVFKAGPFRVGYLGFPAGDLTCPAISTDALLASLRETRVTDIPSCLKLPISAFATTDAPALASTTNPETAIPDLQNWHLSDVSKNLRRDIRKAERSGLAVCELADPAHGLALSRMYEDTIRRHRGRRRYPQRYFEALARLSLHDDRLDVLLATSDDQIAGFAVIVRHGPSSYYLHGGAMPAHRHCSPSDLLLARAIESARQTGSSCFNLMSSPPDQPGLVRYKEKWGAVTREHRTYTVPLRPSYRLFALAERTYRLVSG